MMVLFTFSITKLILVTLSFSLGLLLLIIAYKKLLAYLGKANIISEDYCVLYGIEEQPSKGEIEFYFTTNQNRSYKLVLLNSDMTHHSIIKSGEAKEGGVIIRFDTHSIENGTYFYQLETENQKTMKKFEICN